MVQNKWLSENTKKTCLDRRAKAESMKAPLSKIVELGNDASKIHVSILEPIMSYYSRLGRVMVAYDKKKNTWHCPCSKPRRSCPHKAIAKWHLNHTHKGLFKNTKNTEDLINTISTQSEPLRNQDKYPPEGEALAALIKYLLEFKNIPSDLPKDVTTPQTVDFPRHLVPLETFYHRCKLLLSEPIVITQKAKIATITGIVTGVYEQFVLHLILY